MRRIASLGRLATLACGIAMLNAHGTAFGGQSDGVADRIANHLAPHPRLLIRGDVAAMRERASAKDPRLAAIWRRLLLDADAILTRPPLERRLEGKRLLGVSRDALHRIGALSLAWRATRDPRYLAGARRNVAAVVAFADYNPSHFLDVAEMTAALAIAYDWLHDDLPAEELAAIRAAIATKGLDASFTEPPQWWVEGDNNWNQVCHGGLTLGALAIAEDEPERARRVITRAIDGLPFAMRQYAPDGAYPEGAAYWEYGTTYNLLAIDALETALGTDFDLWRQPGLLQTADYHLHLVGPTGLTFGYSDGSEPAGRFPAAAAFLLAARRREPGLLFNESKAVDRLLASRPPNGTGGHDASLWLLALWAGEGGGGSAAPTTQHYAGGGDTPVATHRTGWDENATFVAIKGGSPSTNHAHMDVGSFCLDADGVRWAGDLGMQDYNSLESRGVDLWNLKPESDRWQVFRIGALSHSVLTVDGHPQVVAGHAPIVRSTERFTVVDTSTVYAGDLDHASRGVRLRDDGSVRVQDEIGGPATRPVDVRWAMLTHAAVQLGEDGTSATLTQAGKRLSVRVALPAGVRLGVTDAERPAHKYDAPNPGAKLLTFHVPLSAGEAGVLAVDLSPAGRSPPTTRPAEPVVPLARW